jgi:regulator of sigma E protease
MLGILAFVLLFLIITFVHELGHLVVAKRAGIRVYELSFGLGPKIFSIKRQKTEYSVRVFPIGGFVRIAGLDVDKEDVNCPDQEKYTSKTPGQKFAAIAAGPIMNLVLAVSLFFIVFMVQGMPVGFSNEVASILPGSPAEAVGIKPGDVLVSINGKVFPKMEDAVSLIHKSSDKQLVLTIKRGEGSFSVKVIPKYNEKMKVGLIGFSPKVVYKHFNVFTALTESVWQTIKMAGLIIYYLGLLIIGKVTAGDIMGPVGIAQVSGTFAAQGAIAYAQFIAFFSINVAVLNLLPLPALDGGRLFFVFLEALRGKPIDIEKENKIHYVGLILLLALAAIITVNDVVRLFAR